MSNRHDGMSHDQPRPPRQQSERHHLARPSAALRQSSSFGYHTFPTAPPRQPHAVRNGANEHERRSSRDSMSEDGGSRNTPREQQGGENEEEEEEEEGHDDSGRTPLPKGQLIMLAVIALAEQTALNSISPYLPDMASTFPGVKESEVGLYVGLIASAFALAQFLTNFAWGWLSDRIGRKPIVLIGTFLTACCFVAFGFCRTLWQAVLVQALMGLVNGNQGVISTCLGEITDRSNQSQAFTYLPVIYGLGGITGPIVGGLLVMKRDPFKKYPYLPPNLFSAAILLIDLVLTSFFLEESLDSVQDLPPLNKRVKNLFSRLWQFAGGSQNPTYTRDTSKKSGARNGNEQAPLLHADENETEDEDSGHGTDEDSDEHHGLLGHIIPEGGATLSRGEIFNRDTILLLVTFLIFQLANIGYNSLYPIFAQAKPPAGRNLTPQEIGISLAFSGVVTILFQVGVFGRLREKLGNRVTYRIGQFGFVVAFLLMPWVGYKDGSEAGDGPPVTHGKTWLWIELGVVLIIKTVASVGGLTSALLLITNSAPSHAVLGTLNGLAQTLSAAGRAVGPFISGALFTATSHVRPKGEALAFGIFAIVSFLGFLLSFGIRGASLEAEGWEESSDDDDEEVGTPSDDDNDDSPRRSGR